MSWRGDFARANGLTEATRNGGEQRGIIVAGLGNDQGTRARSTSNGSLAGPAPLMEAQIQLAETKKPAIRRVFERSSV